MGIILHNPLNKRIPEREQGYPVQDPRTLKTELWSIGAGQTLDFPDYVANTLLDRYGFLQRIVTKDQIKKEQEDQRKLDEGKNFSQIKIVDPSELVMGGSMAGDALEKAVSEEVPENFESNDMKGVFCNECGKQFGNEQGLKIHYAQVHITV